MQSSHHPQTEDEPRAEKTPAVNNKLSKLLTPIARPAADQQRRAQCRLQGGDALGDRGRRDSELGGRELETAGLGCGNKGAALAWVESHC